MSRLLCIHFQGCLLCSIHIIQVSSELYETARLAHRTGSCHSSELVWRLSSIVTQHDWVLVVTENERHGLQQGSAPGVSPVPCPAWPLPRLTGTVQWKVLVQRFRYYRSVGTYGTITRAREIPILNIFQIYLIGTIPFHCGSWHFDQSIVLAQFALYL